MLFADDVVLCGETCDEVERRLENWRKAMEDRGMRVRREKTDYLCLGNQEDQVHVEGSQLKRVEDFKYLGLTVQMDGRTEKEVAERIQTGWECMEKGHGNHVRQEGPCNSDNGPASYAIWYGNSGSDQGPGEKDGGSRDENVEVFPGKNEA